MLDSRRAEKKNRIRRPVGDQPQVSLIDSGWPQRAICDDFCNQRTMSLQRRRQIRVCAIAPRQEYLRSLKPLPKFLRQRRTGMRLRNIFDTESGTPGRLGGRWTDASNLQLVLRMIQANLQLLPALYHRANRLRTGEHHPIKL